MNALEEEAASSQLEEALLSDDAAGPPVPPALGPDSIGVAELEALLFVAERPLSRRDSNFQG